MDLDTKIYKTNTSKSNPAVWKNNYTSQISISGGQMLDQHLKINKFNLLYQQAKEEKNMIILIGMGKALDKL